MMRNEMTETGTDGSSAALNGDFGVLLDSVSRADLKDPEFQRRAYELWVEHRGLLAVRGDDLRSLSPDELIAWAKVFGRIDEQRPVARDWGHGRGHTDPQDRQHSR